jgi:uncharacterized membrane protein YvbJ
MKCGGCGSDLLDDSVYCMVCGRIVGDDQGSVVSYADLPFGTLLVCPECGAKNSRTDRWCGSCDADLEGVKKSRAMPLPKGPDCPKCGERNYENSNYCRRCGTSFVSVQMSYPLSVDGVPTPMSPGSEAPHRHEIIRERQVIMVRCKYCGSLNGPDVQKCSSCGAQM